VLKKRSKGVKRVPLDQLGVSPLNRAISGKHVHALGRRILSVEGFCRFRYNNGLAHEPNPLDPLEVSRYTNRAAKKDPLLALVPEKPLYGSFAKTHLMSLLQALSSGCIYWSDTKDLMVPPAGQAALLEHLKHGMFYEVLSYESVSRDADNLKALIASDNFDAGFGLGQTEIQLLQCIHDATKLIHPPRGMTQWDVVRAVVLRTSGQRWSEEELASLYMFFESGE